MKGKTQLEIEREREFEKHKDNYKFEVINATPDKTLPNVITEFNHIEQVLHKVKLDIMTNANLGLTNSLIVVRLKNVKS